MAYGITSPKNVLRDARYGYDRLNIWDLPTTAPDSVTDWQSIFETACSQAVTDGKGLYLPYLSDGYPFLSEITVTSLPIAIEMDPATYLEAGFANDSACVTLGQAAGVNSDRMIQLNVRRDSQSDWSDTSEIGISLINLNNCDIITDLRYFTGTLDLLGDGAGLQLNRFWIRQLLNFQFGITFRSQNSGWTNGNKFFCGKIIRNAGVNTTQNCYFTRFSSTVYSCNSNILDTPRIEQGSTINTRMVAMLFEGAANNNRILNARVESCGDLFLEVKDGVAADNNFVDVAYTDRNEAPEALVLDRGTKQSNWVQGGVNSQVLAEKKSSVWTSQNMARACQYDVDGELFMPGWFAVTTSASFTPTINIPDTNGSIGDNYLVMPASGSQSPAYGIFTGVYGLDNAPRIIVIPHLTSASYGGRLVVLCFDSSDTQLASTNDEVQSIVATGATSGTITLSLDDGTPQSVAYNASASTVETALDSLVGSGYCSCSGGPLPNSAITITFDGAGATGIAQNLIQADSSSLTGGTAAVTRTTPGGPACSYYGATEYTQFGGCYYSGSNVTTPRVISFRSDVEYAYIGYRSWSGNEVRLRGFTIASLSEYPVTVRSYYERDDGHSRRCANPPTDVSEGSYSIGEILYNDATSTTGDQNEQHTLDLTSCTSGTFKLTFAGDELASAIDVTSNPSAATLQTDLETMLTIYAGDVVVTGGPADTAAYVIEFQGSYEKRSVPVMEITSSSLDGSPTLNRTQTGAASWDCLGYRVAVLGSTNFFRSIIGG